jgi:hypothetical protein
MHLGAYGQAYFAAETMEIVSGEWRGRSKGVGAEERGAAAFSCPRL